VCRREFRNFGDLEAILKSVWIGAAAAVAVLVPLLRFLSGAPDNAGLMTTLNPVEAVKNVAFALGFGAGLPTPLALIVATVILVAVPVATFLLVRRIARRFDGRARG
jgi:hypothetical protein